MHDETFARLWREFCAHCLPVDARSASIGSTPRDADVVPAPEGYPSDRHADDREAKARKARQGMRVSNRSALTIQRLRDERTRREAR